MRGSQRNEIHKKHSLGSLDCPLNPSLGVTLDPISKKQAKPVQEVEKPQRGDKEEEGEYREKERSK